MATIILVILAFLTFVGLDSTFSSWFMGITKTYSSALLKLTFVAFIALSSGLIFREIRLTQLRRGLRHVDTWYFGRNNVPQRTCGQRTIRNTKTKQAYIMDTPLDQLASSGLIEWYTETDQQTNMSEFLKNEGYEFNRRRPWISELAKGTESRFIRFFLWFSL